MNRPDVEGAIAYARRRLENELSPELIYHNPAHTFENVLPAAMELADHCGVSQGEKELLAVAAAFHDIGWIQQGDGHERIGAALVRELLPEFGFGEEAIEIIANLILATYPPATPKTLLQKILVDADLDVLGRDDFWPRNEDLRQEMAQNGDYKSDLDWYRFQHEYLSEHRYYTDCAVSLREPKKQEHIAELKRLLEAADA